VLLAWLVRQHEQRAGTVGFGLGISSWDYLVTQCQALTLYLKLACWPHPLVLDYGLETAGSLSAVWPQAVLVVSLLAVTAIAVARRSPGGFMGASFFIILAPSSSFLPLTTQTIAEHRMYLPLAVIVSAVAVGVHRIMGRYRVAAVGFIAAGLGMLTIDRVAVYESEERIWSDTVGQRPRNPRAHSSLANALVREERWPEALAHFEQAVQLRPDYADAQNDYANVLVRLGRRDDALAHYAAAQQLKPGDDTIRYNFGVALAQAGRVAEAIDNLAAVVAHTPRNAAAQNNLGDALLKTGRRAEALRAFEAAIAADPESAAARNNAGIVLVALGRFGEAVTQYEQALRRLPESAQVHHNLALALDGAGRTAAAIAEEERVLQLAPDFAAATAHLAELRARAGPGR
jgi:tetratricopeptide (TPR) repeat protein